MEWKADDLFGKERPVHRSSNEKGLEHGEEQQAGDHRSCRHRLSSLVGEAVRILDSVKGVGAHGLDPVRQKRVSVDEDVDRKIVPR